MQRKVVTIVKPIAASSFSQGIFVPFVPDEVVVKHVVSEAVTPDIMHTITCASLADFRVPYLSGHAGMYDLHFPLGRSVTGTHTFNVDAQALDDLTHISLEFIAFARS